MRMRMCNVNMIQITLVHKHWPPQAGQHLLNDNCFQSGDLAWYICGASLMRENADESKVR